MTRSAEHAIWTWEQGRRRRAASATADRIADAFAASGGLVLANSVLHLGMAPEGTVGYSLGGTLLAAGLAWIMRTRRNRYTPTQPVASVATRSAYPVVRADATHAA